MMNNTESRDRGFIYACAYLSFLFVSVIAMWWTILFGSNPIHVKDAAIYDANGQLVTELRPGDQFIIKGVMCSTDSVGVEVYPSLDGGENLKYPLLGTVFLAPEGCFKAALASTVPIVPPGEYRINITIKYQNNLVGRDGTSVLPALPLSILP